MLDFVIVVLMFKFWMQLILIMDGQAIPVLTPCIYGLAQKSTKLIIFAVAL